jgi:hypothetical protein
MASSELIFSSYAVEVFRNIVEDMQQVSLLSAEKVRTRILHKLHLIHHQPMQSSKKIEIGLEGHFRVATVLNYKIFYKLENDRVCIVDMLLDKEAKSVQS